VLSRDGRRDGGDVLTRSLDCVPGCRQMRASAMRIGSYGTVGKTDSAPTPAADLFVYLAATALKNDNDPVCSDCLDLLLARKPHVLSPWGPARLTDLVQSIRDVEGHGSLIASVSTRYADCSIGASRRTRYRGASLSTKGLPTRYR
jgi:hypothetical protein